jgi:hypothetical protein
MRSLLHGLLALALAGCATMSSVEDGQKLEPGQGFLALHIGSNSAGNLWYTDYSPSTNFGQRFADAMSGGRGGVHVYQGERYWLLARPAGEYMWYEFNIGTSRARLYSSNRFVIRPGAITYVGHFRVTVADKRLRIGVRDGAADMQRHLAETYPAILKAHPFERQIAEFGLTPQ